MSCDPNTLSVASRCFNCFDPGKKWDVLIYILTQAAGLTTNPETLSVVSRCMECIPDGRKLDIINYLTAQISGSSTNAEGLALASKCFRCIPDGNKLNVILYLYAQIGHVSTEPGPLATASKCFECISDGHKIDVVIYLLTQIAHSSTDPATLLSLSKGLQAMSDGVKWDTWIYLACAASSPTPPAFLPTTPSSSISWWHGGDYFNGTSWADRGVGNFTLTVPNLNTGGTVGTFQYVIFPQTGPNHAFNNAYASTQPHTLVFMVFYQNPGGENGTFAKMNAQLCQGFSGTLYWYENAGSTVSTFGVTNFPSGVWSVAEFVFNGASSALRLNTAVVASGDAGAGAASGIHIGATSDFNDRAKFNILDICTYGGALSASDRTSLYNYFKTTYPSAALP